jgi:hypothetical protein
LVGDSLSLELTGSTRPKKTITGFKDCRASLEGRYRDGPMELGFFLGQTHSKSYAVLSAIDLPSFSASFGGIARGFSNRLEAAYLSREGFFAVAKCDLFAPHEPEIQGGWIFRAPSVAGYLSASTGRRQVTAALLKRTTLGLDIAVKAKYRNRQKVLAQAAIKIIRNATFESTVLSDGTARMRMAFRPVEWIEATVASEASLRNRFQTTNLRWALRISPLHSEAGREQLTSLMSRFSGLVRGE